MMSTKAIAMGGTLAALAIVLKMFSLTTFDLRISFYDIPLMISGVLFGPLVGGLVGFITDWIYSTTQGFPLGLFTISSILWGLIPGLLMLVLKKINVKTITVIVVITSVFAMASNTVALYQFTGSAVFAMLPARIIVMIIKWPIQVIILKQLHQRVILPLNIKRV